MFNTKYEKISSNQIEDDGSEIRQVIFYVNDTTQYTFDVNRFINFHNLKKILAHAARLPKNTFKIYHENDNVDYTNKEEETLNDFFPNDKKVTFKLFIDLIKMSTEENFDLKLQNTICQIHPTKFKTFFCENCQKSICYNCLQSEHMNHIWKEKIDLLAPAEILIREIFRDKENFKTKSEFDKTYDLISFKMQMKNQYFDYLRKMIDQIEFKVNELIDNFNFNVKKCEENVNTNIELLQTYSQEAYILLKNDINTKGIVNDDEIYKILNKKLREIEESKNILTGFNQKYIEINTNYTTIKNYAEKICKEISNLLQTYIENKFYDELNLLIRNQVVQIITKEQVINRMFNDVDVDRRSLSKDNNLSIYRNSVFKNNLNKINHIPNPFEENKNSFFNSEPNGKNSGSNFSQKNQIYSENKTNSFNNNINNQNPFNNNNLNNQNPFQNNQNSQSNFSINNNSQNKNYFGNTQPNFTNLVNNNISNVNYSHSQNVNNFNEDNNNNLIQSLSNEIDKVGNSISGDVIMFPKENQNIILISNGSFTIPLTLNFSNAINTEISEFQKDSCYCNYKNILYLAGGRNKGKISKKFLYFDPSNSNKIIYNYNDSNFSHIKGSMLGYNNYIYLIGGEKSKKCERFNLNTKNWEILSDLTRETQSPILYIYKNYLYAFFGINSDGKIMNTIERLNLNNTKGNWDKVLYNNIDNLELNIIGCGVTLVSDDEEEMLFFMGGKTETEIKNTIYSFKFKDYSFHLLSNYNFENNVYFKENLFQKIGNEFLNFSADESIVNMNIENGIPIEH